MAPGLKDIMSRFRRVMTIETNWSDRTDEPLIDESNRRFSAVAMLLRSRYLVDVDCWTEVSGQPIKPDTVCRVLRERLC
jgi:2-oxoglutarate ferredoxin oxidoreductase subunit alpha